jgi:prevent-host-death family protein
MNASSRWKTTGTVSATDFRRDIAAIFSYVEMAEKPVVIERQGKPTLVMVPVSEWEALVALREEIEAANRQHQQTITGALYPQEA